MVYVLVLRVHASDHGFVSRDWSCKGKQISELGRCGCFEVHRQHLIRNLYINAVPRHFHDLSSMKGRRAEVMVFMELKVG